MRHIKYNKTHGTLNGLFGFQKLRKGRIFWSINNNGNSLNKQWSKPNYFIPTCHYPFLKGLKIYRRKDSNGDEEIDKPMTSDNIVWI